jgi:LCP family protein required for cell wall assembly
MTHSAGTSATIDGALMVEEPEPARGSYKRYRSSRGLRRRESGNPDPQELLAELRAEREALARDGVDEIHEEERPSWLPWRRRRGPRRPRKWWVRGLRWLGALAAVWIGISLVLFVISTWIATGVPGSAVAALSGGGTPPFSATTILVLGSDGRPPGSKEPGASADTEGGATRSDTMMLVRTGGGSTTRLSIPRDTVVDLPGYGLQKINAAFYFGGAALAIKTVESFLGIKINHVIVINFTNFPNLVNAMGGVTWTGGCVDSQISGGSKEGGYSLVLRAGTHHLNGEQALILARTRDNLCNPGWTDLTRELNQQALFAAMKSQVISPGGFIRLPWIAWNAPQTLETDMGPATLAGVAASLAMFGSGRDEILAPTGSETLPGGGAGLTITDAAKQADVSRWLR